ncbi:MAG: alpha/beta hydrolase [Candidatus Acidiferrales bacterium]
MSRMVRGIVIAALAVLVLYAALLTAIYFGRNKLLFPGAGQPVQAVNPAEKFPGAEDFRIAVDGATYLHAWWIPSQSGTEQTLLYFHGNGYALENELQGEAPTLYENRANLLLVDYRGYGASSPIPTTPETTAADARAALRSLIDQRHIAPPNIWIVGRSIGAAVAVRLATEAPNAGGLILITPTTNTADVEPYRRLIRPMVWLGLAKPFDSFARMPQIHIPVTIVAGELDVVAPPWMAQKLFDAANFPKSIKVINGVGHDDILRDAGRAVNLEIESAMLPPAWNDAVSPQ